MRAFGKADGGGRRSAARSEIPLLAIFATLSRTGSAAVADISCSGVRLTGRELPIEGQELEVTVESVRVFGVVVWSTGSECGIAFDDHLAPFEVEALRRRCGMRALSTFDPEERQAIDDWLLCVSR